MPKGPERHSITPAIRSKGKIPAVSNALACGVSGSTAHSATGDSQKLKYFQLMTLPKRPRMGFTTKFQAYGRKLESSKECGG